MGVYTEFKIDLTLRHNTPEKFVSLISHMLVYGEEPEGISLPHHAFFLTKRWGNVFSHMGWYDDGPTLSQNIRTRYYTLHLHADINYLDRELDFFLGWIKSHVAGHKLNQYVGWEQNEDTGYIINLYIDRNAPKVEKKLVFPPPKKAKVKLLTDTKGSILIFSTPAPDSYDGQMNMNIWHDEPRPYAVGPDPSKGDYESHPKTSLMTYYRSYMDELGLTGHHKSDFPIQFINNPKDLEAFNEKIKTRLFKPRERNYGLYWLNIRESAQQIKDGKQVGWLGSNETEFQMFFSSLQFETGKELESIPQYQKHKWFKKQRVIIGYIIQLKKS
jgi:hypothetical protein